MKTVIIGAGITGLALANRLAKLGGEVVVVERSPTPRQQGYMIDFYGPGYDVVKSMGMLPAIEKVDYRLDEASLIDAEGHRRAGVQPQQFADGPLLNLMRPDLEQVLREQLPPQVDLRSGAGPTAIDDHGDGVRVTLDNGATIDADLLVGADGIHSTVRRLVFGPESEYFRYLGFHTMAFTFEDPDIHAETHGRACLTDSIGRQMGFYGLRDGRVAAFGVHRTPDPTLPKDFRAAVRRSFTGLGWVTPGALEKCPPSSEIYYDQVAQIEVPTWTKGRVVLAGDSCYAVSLLAGLGSSLAIAGGYLLADKLARSHSIDQALSEYERLWRPVIEDKQKVGRDAASWFLPTSQFQLRGRRIALRSARLPIIKNALPAILAGKPITIIKELIKAGDPSPMTTTP